ncbi:MAG: triose-phosphate isomerase, partial [Bacteroidetes bacterium]|nr:triose-phosphate isomerase [Bacteroidota bacterium]
MRRKIVAGNWKMNKDLNQGIDLVTEILSGTSPADVLKIIAPPFIHLAAVAEKVKGNAAFAVAAQNCHQAANGAFTGEVSAEMIASCGTDVIISNSSADCILTK